MTAAVRNVHLGAILASTLLACSAAKIEGAAAAGPGGGGGGNVTVAPPSARLPQSGTQAFVSNPPSVVWSVREGAPGGSVSASGYYRAPNTPGNYAVLAFEPVSATTVVVPIEVYLSPPGTFLGMSIPQYHPRLLFDGMGGARLALASTNFNAAPFTPGDVTVGSRAIDWALRGLIRTYQGNVTGGQSDCRTAINHVLGFASYAFLTGAGGDNARWHGETLIVTYDWCYAYLSAGERTQIEAALDQAAEFWRTTAYPPDQKPMNNYWWGYIRNLLEWGLVSYERTTTLAQGWLTEAIQDRYRDNFVARYQPYFRGGLAYEGTEYGAMLANFATIPFESARMMGLDLWAETFFWRDLVYAAIYQTTPNAGPVPNHGTRYMFFPHSDAPGLYGTIVDLDPTQFHPMGNFLTLAKERWAGANVGRHAAEWMRITGGMRNRHVAMVDPATATPLAYTGLPLDFWGSGLQYAFSRSSWSPTATSVMFQMGDRQMQWMDHSHLDYGSWQLWRNGRWLSRESAGYTHSIAAFGGVGTVQAYLAPAHNVLLVEGNMCTLQRNLQYLDTRRDAVVTRIESRPGYAFAAVDLSAVGASVPSQDNPHLVSWVREYVFFRGIETLVVFDRVRSDHAADVKAVLIHSETNPTLVPGRPGATIVNGDQALEAWILLPAAGQVTRLATVVEGGGVGQYRIEVDTSPNATDSYVLQVFQAKDAAAAALSPSVADDGPSFTLTLDGSNAITFVKGMTSTGGSITAAAASGTLGAGVQPFAVTDAGPAWQ